MSAEDEKTTEFVPKYLFTSTLIESFEQENTLRRVITIRGADGIDDSVPLVMNAHHCDSTEKDPFVRYGNNSILICLQYNFSGAERKNKNYYFSTDEESGISIKPSQALADVPPEEIKIEKPFKIRIREVVSEKQDRISHCIEISGNDDITKKFRVYRSNDNTCDEFSRTSERVFISPNKIRIHMECLIQKFPESGSCYNRIADLSSFLGKARSSSFDGESPSGDSRILILENVVQRTPMSLKSADSKTGTPESSQSCDSLTPLSTKSSLLSVKSRPGTPFIRKKKFLSKSSVVPSLPNSNNSNEHGGTFLFTNSSAVNALREGSLFGKSTGPRH